MAQPQQLLAAALTRYTDDGLRLVEQAAAHDDPAQVDQLVAQRVLPLEQAATAAAVGLRNALTVAARTEYEDTLDRNARIRNFAIAGIVVDHGQVAGGGLEQGLDQAVRHPGAPEATDHDRGAIPDPGDGGGEGGNGLVDHQWLSRAPGATPRMSVRTAENEGRDEQAADWEKALA